MSDPSNAPLLESNQEASLIVECVEASRVHAVLNFRLQSLDGTQSYNLGDVSIRKGGTAVVLSFIAKVIVTVPTREA